MPIEQSVKFLLDVWGVQAGDDRPYFCIATKSTGGTWRDHFLQWPIKRNALDEFFDRYSEDRYNLYFCPHGLSTNRRVKEYATPTAFLWGDLDEADPSRCKPKPQIAWETSPGRFAALWRLNDHHDVAEVEEVNRALTYAIGSDKSGWDATQVLRIPGTRNHKYPKSPRGKLLWSRDNQYGLDDFPDSPQETLRSADVLKKWQHRIKRDVLRLLTTSVATHGVRSEMIWRLENELHEAGLNDDEIFSLIKASVWNKFKGRRDEDGQLRRELSKVRENHENGSSQRKGKPQQGESLARPPIEVIRMSDVVREKVKFLWDPYIALGKITIIEGDPGLGKSWFTLALTAELSQGRKFPGQREREVHQGRVLLMSAEDGLGDTIGPRLDTLHADDKRIFAIPKPITLDPGGLEDIDALLDLYKPRMAIIDPVVAYMGSGVDMNKANETRAVLAGIGVLAQKHNAAFVLIRHLTKGTRDKAIYRGLGSIDFTAAARSVLLVGRHPEDPEDSRVICHIKNNLGPLGSAQAYALRKGMSHPFSFEGPVTFTPDEVFKAEATGGPGQWELLCTFLEDTLKAGPKWADEVRRDAEAKGYAVKLVNKARRELGILVTAHGDRMRWQWPT